MTRPDSQSSPVIPPSPSGSSVGLTADDLEVYRGMETGAALIDRSARGKIDVGGADRKSFLHGLLTNDVAALEAGRGCYSAWLTPQGRMVADMRVFALPDRMLIDVEPGMAASFPGRLERLIFAEDVRVEDISRALALVGVHGGGAAEIAGAAFGLAPSDLRAMAQYDLMVHRLAGDVPARIVRADEFGWPGWECFIARDHAGQAAQATETAGARAAGARVVETLRVEAGRPQFLTDMDERTIPLEAGIEARAVSMSKGCFVGHEVIARVTYRGAGRVARRLVTLQIDGDSVPPSGTSLELEGRAVGKITSAVFSPRRGAPIALGYVHRDVATAGARLAAVLGGDQRTAAVVTSVSGATAQPSTT